MKMGNDRVLYIEPCAGLGNRLSALASARYWANEMKMELRIVWKKEPPCAAGYSSIFATDKAISVKEINQMGRRQLHLLQYFYANVWLYFVRRKCYFISAEDTSEIYEKTGMEGIRAILEKNSQVYMKSTSFFATDEALRQENLYNILFNKELELRAESIIRQYENRNIIGIHIRRTDHTCSINNSPTELFIEKINQILERDSSTVFYLATDDADEIAKLPQKGEIVHNEVALTSGKVTRNTESGIKEAVVDMLCLSKCMKIYGTKGSTFSNWAAKIGNTSLEILTKENKRL